MPAELFRPVVSSTLSRRRASLLPVSVAVHAVILAAVAIVPLVAGGIVLPDPARRAMHYIRIAAPTPPPAAAPRSRPAAEPAARSGGARAPVEAPEGIVEETGLEGLPALVDLEATGAGPDFGLSPGGVGPGLGHAPAVVPLPPRAPVPVGGRIKAPVKLHHVTPDYPDIARRARVEGIVIIEAVIGEDGRVTAARVLRSSPLLDRAALTAVRQWAFSPTLLNGQPVPVVMSVTVVFELD